MERGAGEALSQLDHRLPGKAVQGYVDILERLLQPRFTALPFSSQAPRLSSILQW